MGYTGRVSDDDESQNLPDFTILVAKQALHIQYLIDRFVSVYLRKYNIRIDSVQDAHLKLAHAGYSFAYRHVRPVIDDNEMRFKMASVLELLIVQEQVLSIPKADLLRNRELNALFGMTAALSLIECMIPASATSNDFFFPSTNNAAINNKIDQMMKHHGTWLETRHLDEMPIILNAQFYELIELVHSSPLQMHCF